MANKKNWLNTSPLALCWLNLAPNSSRTRATSFLHGYRARTHTHTDNSYWVDVSESKFVSPPEKSNCFMEGTRSCIQHTECQKTVWYVICARYLPDAPSRQFGSVPASNRTSTISLRPKSKHTHTPILSMGGHVSSMTCTLIERLNW